MFFGSSDEHFLFEHPQVAGHVRIGAVFPFYGSHYAEDSFAVANGEVSFRGEDKIMTVKTLKDKPRVQVIFNLVNAFPGIGETVFAFVEGIHAEVALGRRNGVKDLPAVLLYAENIEFHERILDMPGAFNHGNGCRRLRAYAEDRSVVEVVAGVHEVKQTMFVLKVNAYEVLFYVHERVHD